MFLDEDTLAMGISICIYYSSKICINIREKACFMRANALTTFPYGIFFQGKGLTALGLSLVGFVLFSLDRIVRKGDKDDRI